MSSFCSSISLFLQGDLWSKIKKQPYGLLCHDASYDPDWNWVGDLLNTPMLKCLFGPQHGLKTDVQDNMIETPHERHPHLDVPIYSLYSQTRIPSEDMLKDLENVIVDLQDVGTRVYTYIWTLYNLMSACQNRSTRVVVLDRPNPLGLEIREGINQHPDFLSFVGLAPIPMRHGLTIGEMALYFQKKYFPGCELEVVSMEGISRKERGLPFSWINPSPNLATQESAYCFLATVVLEGTNCSEGRGTTRALEQYGHPQLDPYAYLEEWSDKAKKWHVMGVQLRPTWFFPMFQKHAQKGVGGVQMRVTDHTLYRGFATSLCLLDTLQSVLGNHFEWSPGPYEYIFDKRPIDVILGDPKITQQFHDPQKLREWEKRDIASFMDDVSTCLLYH